MTQLGAGFTLYDEIYNDFFKKRCKFEPGRKRVNFQHFVVDTD